MNFYFKYRLFLDAVFALLAGCVVAIDAGSYHLFFWHTQNSLQNFLITIVGTSASLLGLVLAAGIFLVSHVQGARFKILRKSKSYPELLSVISSNLFRLFLLTIYGGISFFISEAYSYPAMVILGAVTAWATMSLFALLWIVSKILGIPLD